ncbi:class GN sortase [Enterovibrio makurazakiensis]|uniref:Class GN sortase n=1 Tax=Enterovibrio gelatinilyticus TaxID=2899819 RepID=A0ABT5QUF9_9GAMM|nr:class GN sortase [Enterovibrio sp. ZSDZ42]MDD1791644.1 class GN sortase [Enterovibrio sp. ZSDZ42]
MRKLISRFWPIRAWQWMMVGLFLGGSVLMVNGIYIKAKAQLAQFLIVYAWDKQQETGKIQPPWPWADTFPTATLLMDGHKPLWVLAGANARNLAFGPTLQMNTARPDEKGNIVIFGHNDTHFSLLAKAKIGDELQLEASNGMLRRFRVSNVAVAHESEVQWIDNTTDDRLTLVTCYPFDSMTLNGPLRYIVTAKPIAEIESHNQRNLPVLFTHYGQERTYWL